jgi:hypothetical protein
MNDNSTLNIFPKTQLKPYDGMPVTAEIWAQAHEEHRNTEKAHDVFFHGAGIVTGLEVLANDPPDQYVFISPGVAVDSEGSVIVLTEPVAYDFGDAMEGELMLLLGHGEREVSGAQEEIKCIQNEFVIAARPKLPKRPTVELAKITLSHRGSAIKNAANSKHPGVDEIDMRCRVLIGPEPKRCVKVAVSTVGGDLPAGVLNGWDYLAREYKRETSNNLVVDGGIAVSPALQNYSIAYLCGSGSFKLADDTIKELKSFLESGKAIIVEAFDDAADDSFKPLIGGLGVTIKPVAEYDAVLKSPYLFNVPPEGSQGNKVLVGKGVIYSSAKYALAWNGKVSGGSGSRSDIRSALEWGVNLIQYCLQ